MKRPQINKQVNYSNVLRPRKLWSKLLLALFIGLGLIILGQVSAVKAQGTSPQATPLPHDCGGFTPGADGNTCCIMGYVYYVSPISPVISIAEGATVTLSTTAGVIMTSTTTPGIHNEEGIPYFSFDLVKAKIDPGTWVTVTAMYREKQHHTVYQVAPGGQQVDVVLPVAQNFEEVTVIVDDQDLVTDPGMPGFHITGPVKQITETACGAGSEFWNGAIYSGTTTANGVGPATITATYRPTLPVTGTYELFAYAPHGCTQATLRYKIYVAGKLLGTPVIDQVVAGQSQGQWISLGEFEFPAGISSSVQVNNLTGHFIPVPLGLDALKWKLRPVFSSFTTITVDDLEGTAISDENGFYRNDASWSERWTDQGCDAPSLYTTEPVFWNDHIYWTYNRSTTQQDNWAQWRPNLPIESEYDLYTFVSHCFATSRTANYQIYISDTLANTVTIDYAPQGGVWLPLGTYKFPSGTSSYVRLDNTTGEDRSLLSFDAVRWTARFKPLPIAVIHKITPNPAIQGEDIITLHDEGIATNEDAEIVTHKWQWVTEKKEVIGTNSVLTIATTALSAGQHILMFSVQDNQGRWSSPITTTFEIELPPPGESWHFMLYLAGDNNLSNNLKTALDRLGNLGTLLDTVTITVQLDQYGSGGAYRYLILSDTTKYEDGINRWYLKESNTGTPQALTDYIQWATNKYPADNVYLAIANHGRGIQGLAWDNNANNDYLTLPELRKALHQGTDEGQHKIDVLHLDACLMSMLEVAHEMNSYADYMVASENLGWSFFAYDKYVQALSPTTKTPRQVAIQIAKIYAEQARYTPYTITALDLSKVHSLSTKVDALANTLLDTWPSSSSTVQIVLDQVQRLDSQEYGQITNKDEFIDLQHFADLLATISTSPTIKQTAQDILAAAALPQDGEETTALIYESHNSGTISGQWVDLENARGIAIYFPNGPSSWDYPGYVDNPDLKFGQDTRWDDFLRQYVGPPALITPNIPSPPTPLEACKLFLPLVLRERQ